MNLKFSISNPKHNLYKKGTLIVHYEDGQYFGLQSLDFMIDKDKYTMNMRLSKNYTFIYTWIFQKERGFKTINEFEQEQLFALTEDILSNCKMIKSLANILKAIKPQTKLYFKLLDKTLSKEEKQTLKKEFRQANQLIRFHNSAYALTAKRRNQKLEESKNI